MNIRPPAPCRSCVSILFVAIVFLFFPRRINSATIVEFTDSAGAFELIGQRAPSAIHVDPADFPGVIRAAGDLSGDLARVGGAKVEIVQAVSGLDRRVVVVGTIGKSALIDRLTSQKKIDVSAITGQWESYLIQVVDAPFEGVDSALVIAGSDKRGTIFGIYDMSQQIGVSPWYWWADVPVVHRDRLYAKPGPFVQGPPKVKYRGIFINDEEPCFGPWAREKFGGVNSKMYAHMFELILRLRGNYLWPAMWGKAFNEDDPENPRLADEYGIVMGTSHHEPMIRAQAEWGKHRKEMGNGAWNYATNEEGLRNFWTQGIERNKSFESLATIGMRGDGDEPMVKGGDMQANVALLEKIVADQRKILTDKINPDITKIPQVWALYKEVADYYAHGMRVPDDVTLLWCDDNWGNIRRLPTQEERNRSGRAGVYYHFDYVGSPRCYKWLNTNPLPKIWEQMNLAYHYGADRVWVVNVGDLKPMELPIEFFLTMAWDPQAMTPDAITAFTERWAAREFGPKHSKAIAEIVGKYAKYNGWRKPELLEPGTFSLVNYQEAERVVDAWKQITADAEAINADLPVEYRDAFYQLVLYPTKASGVVAQMYVAAGRNRLYAKQLRASANDQAQQVRDLFKLDAELSDAYHKLAGGKWNHMMAQTRIGYTSWNDPKQNIMPELTEVKPDDTAAMGVAIEGSESAWQGAKEPAVLAPFDSINQQQRWIEIFRRGLKSFEFTASADQPWIVLSAASGSVETDQRLWVSIDWSKVPLGASDGTITVKRANGGSVPVKVSAIRSEQFTRENIKAFGGLVGPICFNAADASTNVAVAGTTWRKIPDYGRGESAMTIMPVTAPSVLPPADAPRLEYPVLIAKPGQVQVDLITGIALNFDPKRGVRVAVSFDDQAPQVIDAFGDQSFADPSKRGDMSAPAIRDWHAWVRDNARKMKSTHKIESAGVHVLKIRMVDPAVVLQSIVVNADEVRPSYFGPPPVSVGR